MAKGDATTTPPYALGFTVGSTISEDGKFLAYVALRNAPGMVSIGACRTSTRSWWTRPTLKLKDLRPARSANCPGPRLGPSTLILDAMDDYNDGEPGGEEEEAETNGYLHGTAQWILVTRSRAFCPVAGSAAVSGFSWP